MFYLIVLAVLVFAPFTAFLASQRGYDIMPWYMVGLLVGPLGLLTGLLPKRKHAPEMLFAADLQSQQIG
jgi:hypothetical protein